MELHFEKFFAEVPDFRMNRRKLHKLTDILAISVCALICGANDFEDIAHYGRLKFDFLRSFLDLPNGIPSHDTFYRVFKFLDKNKFSDALHRWSAEILEAMEENFTHINIDGKVLRGTAESGKKKSGICVVSAWVAEHHLVLGQQKVESKSNEKTAIPELLESLDLKDGIVSIDAIAWEKKNPDLIVEKQGNYIFALEKNKKKIYEQVVERLEQTQAQLPHNQSVDFGSGRIETRACYVENDLKFYDDLAAWSHLKSIIMVEAKREIKGKITVSKRYYLSNLSFSAEEFNRLIRRHWSIENSLHWQLDVSFAEDRQRVKAGNAAENFGTLRKIALQVLQRLEDKESIKSRRKMAGWSDDYLVGVLRHF